jgi:hypothetical protein
MVCHECGKPVEPNQRFCGNCGASLRGITDRTEVVAEIVDADGPVDLTPGEPEAGWSDDDPVWAATGAVPVTGAAEPLHTTDLPATEPVLAPVPPMEPPAWTLGDLPDATREVDVWAASAERHGPPTSTAEMPIATTAIPAAGTMPARPRARFGAVTFLGLLAAIAGLLGSFSVAVSVESDTRLVPTDTMPPTFRTGSWYVDDFADNLSVGVLIAAVLVVVGGIAAMFRWRWGSGLAAGGGLALGGLAALSVGLAQFPIQAARDFAAIPNAQQFTLTLTRDIGYWLLIGAGGLGVLVFFAALNDAFGDLRPGLNPWFAALGALATATAVLGPMLPEGTAVFSDNWYRVDQMGEPPALLLVGRLVQLALLLLSGVIGYLSVRRWGLGLAIGGSLPIVWLGVSTLFDVTSNPIGPAYRNPGADDADLHGVTIIGLSAIIAMAILAIVAAYDQTTRERR